MMRARRIMAAGAVCATILGLVTACGGNGSGAAGQAGDLRIGMSAGLDLLDPTRTANGPDMDVMNQIYETLLQLNPETKALEPKLATSYQLINPTTWQFKLRTGVRFSDGEPFDANAVKYSIERIRNPKTNSPSRSQLSSVKSVDIVDPATVNIVTARPDPVLPRRMQPIGGSGRVYMVPPKYFAEHTDQEVSDKPVGTGPFKLDAWSKGQSLTLVQNPDYWGKKPQVTKAVFTFIQENSTRVNALSSGEVDLIQRVPIENVEQLKKNGTHVAMSPDGLVHTLLLDTRTAPFDNIKVRQAFAYSLNVSGFVKDLLKGYGRQLAVPMAPTVSQFDQSIKPYPYDPEAAKQLLKEAGVATPIALSTKTSNGRYVADKDIYQVINNELNGVGFQITPQIVEWGRLIAQMQSHSAGPFYIIGWDFGEGDASKMNSFLQTGATLSISSTPEYDKLAAEANATTDAAKNKELWQQAEKVIHDSFVVAAAWQANAIYGERDRIDWAPKFGENLDLSTVAFKS